MQIIMIYLLANDKWVAMGRQKNEFTATAGGRRRRSSVRCESGHFSVVDLFAGAGLFSDSFVRQGFHVSLAIENDRRAAESYRRNLGDHVICSDIRAIAPEGGCDVLIGGPPCQGFSTLGKRCENDVRNDLAMYFVSWARALQPKVIVVENVEAFASSSQCAQLASEFEKMGYDIDTHVLDASEYGAAQRRRRSFTIGTRVGPIRISRLEQFSDNNVREAWKGLTVFPDGKNWHYSPEPSEVTRERMRKIPPGGGKADLMRLAPELCPPSWWRSRVELTDVWGRLGWDRPSNTVRTCFNNASKGRYIHPDQDRVISLREGARLQSIPDDYQFYGYPVDVARQIGNSVPPALGCAVAEGVRQSLVA